MMILFFLLLLINPLMAAPEDSFSEHGKWIKVGLGRPSSQPLFFYKGKLQILDGKKVVLEMNSLGRFWIIRESGNKSSYCLRIASGNTDELEKGRNHLRKEMGSLSYNIIRHKGKKHAYLETGRIASKGIADKMMKKIRQLGYPKVSLIKLAGKRTGSYTLVDRKFNRHKLGSLSKLGLRPASKLGTLTFSGKEYRGVLYLKWNGSTFRIINFLPLETYLRGVVPGEMGPVVYPRLEALKAQAVAARTYALRNMGKFKSQGFDICDTPRCQVYEGVQVEHELSDQAILETQGEVMVFEGKMIDSLYTSTCGGETDPVENVFPTRDGKGDPYLAGVSSYIPDNSGWNMTLPVNSKLQFYNDLQVRSHLLGIQNPDLSGKLSNTMLRSWFKDLSWILGEPEAFLKKERWTGRDILDQISKLPFIRRSAKNQCAPEDMARFKKYSQFDVKAEWFFLLRYGGINTGVLKILDSEWNPSQTLGVLVNITETFGPETTWKRYFVDHLTSDGLVIRDWKDEYNYPLDQLELVLVKEGDDWAIPSKIYFQMWDKVYLPNGSMDAGLIYLKPSGWAASVDRSSPYSSWIEKKTVEELEKQTKKYISGVKGIRDLKIIAQAKSGRVTELEVISKSGTYKVVGLKIRRILGIRDNLFEFLPQYKNGELVSVTFVGKGWGHGVGMSQVGAFGLALEGWNYREILKHYYKDIDIIQAGAMKTSK